MLIVHAWTGPTLERNKHVGMREKGESDVGHGAVVPAVREHAGKIKNCHTLAGRPGLSFETMGEVDRGGTYDSHRERLIIIAA